MLKNKMKVTVLLVSLVLLGCSLNQLSQPMSQLERLYFAESSLVGFTRTVIALNEQKVIPKKLTIRLYENINKASFLIRTARDLLIKTKTLDVSENLDEIMDLVLDINRTILKSKEIL